MLPPRNSRGAFSVSAEAEVCNEITLHGTPRFPPLLTSPFHSTAHTMPASGERERSGRKGQYSCDFCRARKLRCDRPLPCTSCKSRGKTCHFGPASEAPKSRGRSTPVSAVNTLQEQYQGQQEQQVQVPPVSTASPQSRPSPQLPASNQGDLLAEIQALRRLTQALEKRIVQSTTGHQRHDHHGGDISLSPSASSPGGRGPTPHSDLGQVGEVVAYLQRVSMGQSSHEPIYVDDLVFKVERIRAIPQAPTYTAQLGRPTPCVWLPRHAEARALLDCYITDLSYIQHVVHHPSLPAAIDDVYRQIEGQGPVRPGSLVLLLSIFANATHVWAPRDDGDSEGSLFLSSAQANAQTPLWIKATYAVLNAAQNDAALALETIQGIIILSFVICNLEGVSLRYRSLISTALLLGRELGLHRLDHEARAAAANTLQVEMGRRVWWYLVATDWYVFSCLFLPWLVDVSNSMIQAVGREIRRPVRECVSDPPASHDGQQAAQHQRRGFAGKWASAGPAYIPADRHVVLPPADSPSRDFT